MELQDKVDSLERQLKKQGRSLAVTAGLLILTIGFLITRWILGIEGRLDVQGKRVYVHSGGGSLITSTIRPHGMEAHSLDDPSAPYGRHASLGVTRDKTQLLLSDNASTRSRDLELFVSANRSGLSIRDDQQRERVRLSVSEDGPKLRMMDEKGQVVFQAP